MVYASKKRALATSNDEATSTPQKKEKLKSPSASGISKAKRQRKEVWPDYFDDVSAIPESYDMI